MTQRSSRGEGSTKYTSILVSTRAEVTSTALAINVPAYKVSRFSPTPMASSVVLAHLRSAVQMLLLAVQSLLTLARLCPSAAQVPILLPMQVASSGEQASGAQVAPPLPMASHTVPS